MDELQKENEYLKQRIEFLELLVASFSETSKRAINTNELLLKYVEKYYPKKSSTSS